VLRQVEKCQDDPASLNTVLEAVRDQVFSIRVNIFETLDEPPPSAAGEVGTWRLAEPRQTTIELALVWPPSERFVPNTGWWSGQATILGFDTDIDCLVMRVTPASNR
jgi:hypothetical protein